jgi:HSP20 family protein
MSKINLLKIITMLYFNRTDPSTYFSSLKNNSNTYTSDNTDFSDFGLNKHLYSYSYFYMTSLKYNLNVGEDKTIIELALPGYKKENITIALKNKAIEISGKIENLKNDDKNMIQQSTTPIKIVDFTKKFELYYNVDANNIKTKFEDGILRIELPKLITKDDTIKILID